MCVLFRYVLLNIDVALDTNLGMPIVVMIGRVNINSVALSCSFLV